MFSLGNQQPSGFGAMFCCSASLGHAGVDRARGAIANEIQQKLRREQVASELSEATIALERARTTEVVLPEDLDSEHYERNLAEALDESDDNDSPTSDPAPEAPMAIELAVTDVAELYGVQPMTARRWRAGTSNPPIDAKAWIKVNEKDWRYPVSAIDDRALARIPADDPQAALDSIRRKRAALGFGRRNGRPKPDEVSLAV
jgi:hypothetical protein